MIYETVKTEEQALEIIDDYIVDNKINKKSGIIKTLKCQCECGETSRLLWYNKNIALSIAVCDSCGDNEAFKSDVLHIQKYS